MIASLGKNLVNDAAQNVANNALGAAGTALNGAAGTIANSAVGAAGTIANSAVGNLLNGAVGTSAIPGIDPNLATGAMGSLASGAIGQSLASLPAQEPAQEPGSVPAQEPGSVPAQEPAQVPVQAPPPTNDPSSLSQVLKSAIVQLLNTLNEDTEFKQMIAEQATNTVYSAIDEKCGKVQQIISNLQNIQADFEKNGSVDYETLKEAVAKYNQGFNLILEGQKRITGGSKRRRQITRRKSFSRAFRKTRGRRQSSR
jgi:hypothetical protein